MSGYNPLLELMRTPQMRRVLTEIIDGNGTKTAPTDEREIKMPISKLEKTYRAMTAFRGREVTAKEISALTGLPPKSTAHYLQLLADAGRVERRDVFNRRYYYLWRVGV